MYQKMVQKTQKTDKIRMSMLQSDVKVYIQRRLRYPVSQVEHLSGLEPLLDKYKTKKEWFRGMFRLIGRRRKRLSDLRDAGCEWLSGSKYAYSRNCRPPAVGLAEAMRGCNFRICPFCHARRVGFIFKRIYALTRKYANTNTRVKLVSFKHIFEEYDSPDRIFLDNSGLDDTFYRSLDRHCKFREHVRKNLFKTAKAGCSWCSFEPKVFKEQANDGACGMWKVTHTVVGIVPIEWISMATKGKVAELKDLGIISIAEFIGCMFKYPIQWMKGDVEIVAGLINATARWRSFSNFGDLVTMEKCS